MEKTGGYENIYKDLLNDLKSINLADAAKILDLSYNQSGQVELPFLGRTYLLGPDGVLNGDGKKAPTIHGSVMAGYVLTRGSGEPAGRFVPLDRLTALVPSSRSYSSKNLGPRLAKYAEKDPSRFQEVIEKLGGNPGGEVGSGGKSWIIYLFPKIPVQLILYEGDDEFPSVARLLFDLTAVNFLEFEFLGVLATVFVEEIVRILNSDQKAT